jgi:hypothetical protein
MLDRSAAWRFSQDLYCPSSSGVVVEIGGVETKKRVRTRAQQ